MATATNLVLSNEDLLLKIFELVRPTPSELVTLGRVCRQWRHVHHANARLLVTVATPEKMTRTVLRGLYALSSAEARILPYEMRARKAGGYMYLYSRSVADEAWAIIGDVPNWSARLAQRAIDQRRLECRYGADWRQKRWSPYWWQTPEANEFVGDMLRRSGPIRVGRSRLV